ncbi:radical SAM protein [Holophaga foetida]|uniref:radical SAM protein n=1 Tax=Holophaga foetida TaxID=35839 RepID=UPI0002474CD3|nr:radical SAM protein [Holophaga foetida]
MSALVKAHLDHRRSWCHFDYCYPVISRRSKGVSLGVNLNPDKVCNFHCVYCEVDRNAPIRRKDVDLDQLEQEMAALLDLVASGELFGTFPFSSALPEHRRLNDIAFSGDGEPTTSRGFRACVERLAALKRARGMDEVKLVLITNATCLQDPEVVEGIDLLMAHGGEIWAKLDAGTEASYRTFNRSAVPFARVLENLSFAVSRWPVFIQTLFQEWQGRGPSEEELATYVERIRELRSGGRLQGLQVYTVARPTPELASRPLGAATMDALAERLRSDLPGLPVEIFYGPAA